jgi:hypothetical protein
MKEDRFAPENVMKRGPEHFFSTLQIAAIGWLASLVDKHSSALNVFDLWLRLFPRLRPEIEAVQAAIQPQLDVLHEFRSEVAFHANKSLDRQRRAYENATTPEMAAATRRFFDLCIEVIREEDSVPMLRQEVQKLREGESRS